MTVTPTKPIAGSAMPTQPAPQLLRFRCSHPSISGGQEHLYHAKSDAIAAVRFVNDLGSPGAQYEVRVQSDTCFAISIIACEKQA